MIAALVLAALCTPLSICLDNGNVSPCATPTPTLQWDHIPDTDLKGYRMYVEGQPHIDFPCEWGDPDENGVFDFRWCRGADYAIPLQRYCPGCLQSNSYTITIKAFDSAGNESAEFSNALIECMPLVCAPPGPCN